MDSFINFFKGIFSIISYIGNYVLELVGFITTLCTTIVTLSITFFTSMPSFISMGLLSIFSLGITILIIKLYSYIKG